MSFLFGGGSGGQTKEQKALTGAETDIAQFGLGEAKKTLPKATSALAGPQNFFQALLSGDRNAILNAIAPEVDTLTSQYATGRKTAEQFAPRGGGRGAALAELPTRQAADISKLVHGARLTGAQGLMSVGQLFGQIGLGEMGAGTTAATTAFGDIQTAKENQQQQAANTGAAIGGLIALLAGV